MYTMSATRRLLRSPLVDLLVGPHGIDRYLELVRPTLTVSDARAEVLTVRHQTPRSVTVTLRPNAAWRGFRAGQFVRVGVEIDGVRRTRTYSPASSEHAAELELTVTVHPDGLVSRHLQERLTPGAVLHLGQAGGDFVLPRPLPERLVLISGGSGVTPLVSMLRTLRDEGYGGEIDFIHFARASSDWLYRTEVEGLPNVKASFIATRESGGHLHDQIVDTSAHAAVCGPPALLEAARDLFSGERLLTETFTPPSLSVNGAAAEGTLRFLRSGHEAPIAGGTLLEQVEAAGLTPNFGCRMGICHTCTCRKSAGAVRDMRTGAVSDEEDEDIQLCVSVPAGDVALEI
jgi:stearoyl-CoA 9-desaturase NADPH oxidoreductase